MVFLRTISSYCHVKNKQAPFNYFSPENGIEGQQRCHLDDMALCSLNYYYLLILTE